MALTNKDATLLHAGNFKFLAFASLAAGPLNFDPGAGAIISTKLLKMKKFAEITHVHALAWWSHVMSYFLDNLDKSVRVDAQKACLF